MKEETIIYQCSSIGVAGTTPVHVQKNEDGKYEARVGIAIMGMTNMDEEGFKACDNNPFHERFYDNYAHGFGDTEEKALTALKADMRSTAASIWAI